jgi:hypothetical protein
VGTRRSWNPNRLIVPVWLRRSSWQLTEPASLDTLTFGRKKALAMQKQNSLFQSTRNGGRAIVSNKQGTKNKLVQERRSATDACTILQSKKWPKRIKSHNVFKCFCQLALWHFHPYRRMMNAQSHRHSNLYCWHTRPCM